MNVPTVDRIEILGVRIAQVTRPAAVDLIAQRLQHEQQTVFFANAHTLNTAAGDHAFRGILNGATWVLNDGIGVSLAARTKGAKFAENLNGTDFSWALLALAERENLRVYLFGAVAGVAETASEAIQRQFPNLTICGTRHGFSGSQRADVSAIAAARPDVVFVALGNPGQEKWLAKNLAATGAKLGVGVGAFLDFASGTVPRAPVWVRCLRLEWLFRLGLEPRRLGRRYLVGNPLFMARVLGDASRSAAARRRSVSAARGSA